MFTLCYWADVHSVIGLMFTLCYWADVHSVIGLMFTLCYWADVHSLLLGCCSLSVIELLFTLLLG